MNEIEIKQLRLDLEMWKSRAIAANNALGNERGDTMDMKNRLMMRIELLDDRIIIINKMRKSVPAQVQVILDVEGKAIQEQRSLLVSILEAQ